MTDLLQGVSLLEGGREDVAVAGGGYSRSVPTGYYAVKLNRLAFFGNIPRVKKFKGIANVKDDERVKIGFEILKCVKAIDPKAADFELTKDFGEGKEPYTIDVGGMFDVTRSTNAKAGYPKLIKALVNNLPLSVAKKAKKDGGIKKIFPTLKSLWGQEYILYIHETLPDKEGRSDNIISFTDGAAAEATELNEKREFNKEAISAGIELYRIDKGDELEDIEPCMEKLTSLDSKAILWDVDDPNMKQVHLESVANEYLWLGDDACPIAGKTGGQYCQILGSLMSNAKFKATKAYEMFLSQELKVPEVKEFGKKDDDDKTKEKETKAKKQVKETTSSIDDVADDIVEGKVTEEDIKEEEDVAVGANEDAFDLDDDDLTI